MSYLRINKFEEKSIAKISSELNQQRLSAGKGVLKESEIFHEIFKKAIEKLKVEDGEIKFK